MRHRATHASLKIMQKIENLGVIGAGLIGGSIARAAKAYNAARHITIIEADKTKAEQAAALGLGDVCTTEAAALKDCDLVILATSVTVFARLAQTIMPHLKPGCILSDVASVKGKALSEIAPYKRDDIHFIPAHPIAGTQFSGLEAGFPELFAHKYLIITPQIDADKTAVATLSFFWETLGAYVEVMDIGAHDAAFATTSHLPHAIAFSLMQAAQDQAQMQGDDILKFSASSFGDYTRVAGSDPALWRDIFMANRESLLASLAAFNAKIAQVIHMLHVRDEDKLVEFITQSRAARHALEAHKEKGTKGF